MSIYRVSSNISMDNGVFYLKNRQFEMDKVHNQLSTGKKYRLPREGVTDVAQGLTYHTKLNRISQYMRNISYANNERQFVESNIHNAIELMQRARELAVQGSNGHMNADQRKVMSEEVDQLLREMIQIANSKYKDNFIHSGFKKYTKPFEIIEGAVRGADHTMIREVRYLGDSGKKLFEVDTGEYVSTTIPGSDLFWAEQFQIYSNVNTADFRLNQDTSILVDNVKIDFTAGDNIYAIVDKINRTPIAVNAQIDAITGGLIIKSSSPHKVELSDIEGGTLLQDLGILEPGRPIGPDNYNYSATVFGGSVFDVMIGLRDSMISNNAEDIGGRFLGALDYSLDNLVYHRSESGALTNRLNYLEERMTDDKESYTIALSEVEDINVADSISELKVLDYSHRVALASLAKIQQTSLMDFIR